MAMYAVFKMVTEYTRPCGDLQTQHSLPIAMYYHGQLHGVPSFIGLPMHDKIHMVFSHEVKLKVHITGNNVCICNTRARQRNET